MLQLIVLFGLTLVAFALVIGLMAVGVMLGRRSIQGSCGGLANTQGEEGAGGCSLCSDPSAACRELGRGQGAALRADGPSAAEVDCHDQCEANGCTPEEIEACNHSR